MPVSRVASASRRGCVLDRHVERGWSARSAMMKIGRLRSAMAIATRWRMRPENWLRIRLEALVGRPCCRPSRRLRAPRLRTRGLLVVVREDGLDDLHVDAQEDSASSSVLRRSSPRGCRACRAAPRRSAPAYRCRQHDLLRRCCRRVDEAPSANSPSSTCRTRTRQRAQQFAARHGERDVVDWLQRPGLR